MGGFAGMLLFFLALAIFGSSRRLGILLLGSLFLGLLVSIVSSVMLQGVHPMVAVQVALFILLIVLVLLPVFLVRLVRQRKLYFPATNRKMSRRNIVAIIFGGLLLLITIMSVLGAMATLGKTAS